eukprot:9092211-Pyramimonas_sp.AAC.3
MRVGLIRVAQNRLRRERPLSGDGVCARSCVCWTARVTESLTPSLMPLSPAIISMSLGGGVSLTIDAAVNAAVASGVPPGWCAAEVVRLSLTDG